MRKKSTQPEKVETSAERRTREPREKEDRADVDRRLEIDVSTSSTFLSYEENNVWVAEQLGEKYVQACGRWERFQRSKSLPGFTQARASWAIAWEQYLKSHGYAETSSGRLDIRELFSRQFRHDPAGALQRYAFLVVGSRSTRRPSVFRQNFERKAAWCEAHAQESAGLPHIVQLAAWFSMADAFYMGGATIWKRSLENR